MSCRGRYVLSIGGVMSEALYLVGVMTGYRYGWLSLFSESAKSIFIMAKIFLFCGLDTKTLYQIL